MKRLILFTQCLTLAFFIGCQPVEIPERSAKSWVVIIQPEGYATPSIHPKLVAQFGMHELLLVPEIVQVENTNMLRIEQDALPKDSIFILVPNKLSELEMINKLLSLPFRNGCLIADKSLAEHDLSGQLILSNQVAESFEIHFVENSNALFPSDASTTLALSVEYPGFLFARESHRIASARKLFDEGRNVAGLTLHQTLQVSEIPEKEKGVQTEETAIDEEASLDFKAIVEQEKSKLVPAMAIRNIADIGSFSVAVKEYEMAGDYLRSGIAWLMLFEKTNNSAYLTRAINALVQDGTQVELLRSLVGNILLDTAFEQERSKILRMLNNKSALPFHENHPDFKAFYTRPDNVLKQWTMPYRVRNIGSDGSRIWVVTYDPVGIIEYDVDLGEYLKQFSMRDVTPTPGGLAWHEERLWFTGYNNQYAQATVDPETGELTHYDDEDWYLGGLNDIMDPYGFELDVDSHHVAGVDHKIFFSSNELYSIENYEDSLKYLLAYDPEHKITSGMIPFKALGGQALSSDGFFLYFVGRVNRDHLISVVDPYTRKTVKQVSIDAELAHYYRDGKFLCLLSVDWSIPESTLAIVDAFNTENEQKWKAELENSSVYYKEIFSHNLCLVFPELL